MMLHRFEDLSAFGTVLMVSTVQELQDKTQRGWALIGVLETTEVVEHTEEVPNPKPPDVDTYRRTPGYNEFGQVIPLTKHYVVTKPVFLLAEPKNDTLKNVSAELDTARDEAQDYLRQVGELQEKVRQKDKIIEGSRKIEETLEEDKAKLEEALGAARKDAQAAIKAKKAAVQAKENAEHQYHLHMGILWQELGAAKMRDILGPDVQSPIGLPKPKTAMERLEDDDDIPF